MIHDIGKYKCDCLGNRNSCIRVYPYGPQSTHKICRKCFKKKTSKESERSKSSNSSSLESEPEEYRVVSLWKPEEKVQEEKVTADVLRKIDYAYLPDPIIQLLLDYSQYTIEELLQRVYDLKKIVFWEKSEPYYDLGYGWREGRNEEYGFAGFAGPSYIKPIYRTSELLKELTTEDTQRYELLWLWSGNWMDGRKENVSALPANFKQIPPDAWDREKLERDIVILEGWDCVQDPNYISEFPLPRPNPVIFQMLLNTRADEIRKQLISMHDIIEHQKNLPVDGRWGIGMSKEKSLRFSRLLLSKFQKSLMNKSPPSDVYSGADDYTNYFPSVDTWPPFRSRMGTWL